MSLPVSTEKVNNTIHMAGKICLMDNYCLVDSMENMAHLRLNDLDMEVVFPHLWRAIQKKRLAHFTIHKTLFPIFPASIYSSPKYSLVKSRLFAFKSQYLFVFRLLFRSPSV